MKSLLKHFKRPVFAVIGIAVVLSIVYGLWSPGKTIRDGHHDRGENAMWIQHGWLGADSWFEENQRDKSRFRSKEKVGGLIELLDKYGVTTVFPHLCPCDSLGVISAVDTAQTELFLDGAGEVDVVPWVGGVLGKHCFPESPQWREKFVNSVNELLAAHPRLAGIQVNIEPLPSGNPSFLSLLDELRVAIPEGKTLSVAAYPPPTRWQPSVNVHWDEAYFREVASRVDQVAPMMYDTSIRFPKFYEKLMANWTLEILEWSGDAEVLLGLAAYDDEGVGYHYPHVENLKTGLAGIHAALNSFEALPPNYRGVAIYSEWEMDEDEWSVLRKEFLSPQ